MLSHISQGTILFSEIWTVQSALCFDEVDQIAAHYLNVSDVLSEFCWDDVQFCDVDGVAGVGDVIHLEVRHVHPWHLVLEEPERRRSLNVDDKYLMNEIVTYG